MKRTMCLMAALLLSFSAVSCTRIRARVEIRQANEFYDKEEYAKALQHYEAAQKIDPASFPDLWRLIGYSNIGLFQPDNNSPANQKYADRAIDALNRYLKLRPNDTVAREALINLFLNANRTGQAIDFFREYLKAHPADLDAVKSIATLYAKQGNFNEALNWYEKITLLDAKNPESFYIFGVVCYEKVSKNPPEDMNQRFEIINRGRAALERAQQLRPDYFEAIVYLNLLYREEAKLQTDPVKQQELLAKADEYRNRAIEISKKKKSA